MSRSNYFEFSTLNELLSRHCYLNGIGKCDAIGCNEVEYFNHRMSKSSKLYGTGMTIVKTSKFLQNFMSCSQSDTSAKYCPAHSVML